MPHKTADASTWKGSGTNWKFIVSAAKYLTQKSVHISSSEESAPPQNNYFVPFRESVPAVNTTLSFEAVPLLLPTPFLKQRTNQLVTEFYGTADNFKAHFDNFPISLSRLLECRWMWIEFIRRSLNIWHFIELIEFRFCWFTGIRQLVINVWMK